MGNIYLYWTQCSYWFSSEEEISSEDEDELIEEKKKQQKRVPAKRKLETEDYPSFMAKRFADFTVYRNRTLQKWHDKTKLASGKLGKASVCALVCVRLLVQPEVAVRNWNFSSHLWLRPQYNSNQSFL